MSDQLDVSNTVTKEKFDPNELFSTLKMFVPGDVDEAGLKLYQQNKAKWVFSRFLVLEAAFRNNDRMQFRCVLKDLAAGIGVDEAIKVASYSWEELYIGRQYIGSMFFSPHVAFQEAKQRYIENTSQPTQSVPINKVVSQAALAHSLETKDMIMLAEVLDQCISALSPQETLELLVTITNDLGMKFIPQ